MFDQLPGNISLMLNIHVYIDLDNIMFLHFDEEAHETLVHIAKSTMYLHAYTTYCIPTGPNPGTRSMEVYEYGFS